MIYRSEIDGIRALAVLPVIFFHAGFESFSGGFIGVDIFFVISGYLITNIILNSIEKNTFSLVNFYERRARRILPALIFILLISCLASYFFMLPDELENVGQSIIATILFTNNILLQITSGYWGLDPSFKPLLHTWSLGIEGQFYIIFPILLIILNRFMPNFRTLSITTLMVLSFCIGIYLANKFPTSSFLGLHTRGYELLVGYACSIYLRSSQSFVSLKAKQILSLLGLSMILLSIFTFNETLPYPGLYSLLPVLGTALLLVFSTQGTVLFSLLRVRIIVATGLISYSLYLWHQFLFAYARLASNNEPSIAEYLMLIILSFFLAFLTERFIEKPYRNKSSIGKKSFITHMIITTSFILIASASFVLTKGFSDSFYGESNYGNQSTWQNYVSFRSNIANQKSHFEEVNKIKLLVLGQSYSEDFINILDEANLLNNSELIWRPIRESYDCNIQNENHVFMPLIKTADILIFGSGHFSKECYLSTIQYLENKNIDVFYIGHKEFGYNLNFIKLDKTLLHKGHNYSQRLPKEEHENMIMRTLIPSRNYISIMDLIIDASGMVKILDDNGNLLSVDGSHLTKPGAKYLASLYKQQNNRLNNLLKNNLK